MQASSFQDLVLPDGFIRWIHSTHKSHLPDILKKGFQTPQLFLSGSAVSVSTTAQFAEELEKYFATDYDPRFRLGKNQPNVAVIMDLPEDISQTLNNTFAKKPDPPKKKEVKFNQGEMGFYIPSCFVKAVCYGDGHMDVFNGPTNIDIQEYRRLIESAQKQKHAVTKPKRPIEIPKPTTEKGPDVW